jgi:zinc and cadmium transporter
MNLPSLYPLLILFIFPLAGGIMAYYTNKEWKRVIRLFLSFSGAFLFSITLLNFIPEVYEHLGRQAGYWVLGGFFFQIILERFTHGIEHGHNHVSAIKNFWPIFIGLGLHAFLEGIPVGGYSNNPNEILNNGLLYGVALHEMPAAFVLAISLRAIMPNTKLWLWIVFYALFCPAGAVVGFYVESADHGNEIFQILLAFVAGTFLHISTTILFENSENHAFPTRKLLAILIGTGLALLTQLL